MKIKILGTGCPNCQKLQKNVELAISELKNNDFEVEKIEEIDKIIGFGVISTPALVINGEVKSSGRIPEIKEIKDWVNKHLID
ncbi:MAG TPA: thioredoxin family protein [bacterium]|nr:thioredoxin family protein [bacterium]